MNRQNQVKIYFDKVRLSYSTDTVVTIQGYAHRILQLLYRVTHTGYCSYYTGLRTQDTVVIIQGYAHKILQLLYRVTHTGYCSYYTGLLTHDTVVTRQGYAHRILQLLYRVTHTGYCSYYTGLRTQDTVVTIHIIQGYAHRMRIQRRFPLYSWFTVSAANSYKDLHNQGFQIVIFNKVLGFNF